eukprot:3766962-Rhodomonas_salina.1
MSSELTDHARALSEVTGQRGRARLAIAVHHDGAYQYWTSGSKPVASVSYTHLTLPTICSV